jgi:integrase
MVLWLEQRQFKSQGSRYDYALLIKNQIAPFAIAKLWIEEILPMDVEAWKTELMAWYRARYPQGGEVTGSRRFNMALYRLRTAMNWAVINQKMTSNPALLVGPVSYKKKRIDPFTEQEVERIYAACKKGYELALIMLLIETGMRPSEALGLKREVIDFEAGKIHVELGRTVHGLSPELKTPQSDRYIDISDRLYPVLKAHLASNIGGDFIFRNDFGNPVVWPQFVRQRWPRVLRHAKLTYRNPYQCRHTFAVPLIEADENPRYIAEQMGHANLHSLFTVYSRWFKNPQRRADRQPTRHLTLVPK